MTDPNPLVMPLSSAAVNYPAEAPPSPNILLKNKPSFDDKIEQCIGDFGWKQLLQAILVSFAWVFDAQQTFISVFTDAEPTWHCTNSTTTTCTSSSNICHLPKNSWSWDLPSHASIISEWSLECSGSFITGLPASSFFLGCIAGGFLLATLADSSLGRKNLLVISSLLMSLSGVLTIFSTNVWIYAALRFVCGFGRGTIGTCALVLSTELVGKRWRGQAGIIGFFCFTLGFLSLPLMAILNNGSSWRILYLWSCVPTIFYSLIVHIWVRESPRWLYVRGRKQEFVDTLKCIATMENRSSLTLSFFGSSIELCDPNTSNEERSLYSSMKIFCERSWAYRRLIAVMAIGFGNGLVYYGMPLALGALALNIYLSVTLNALAELPASLVVFFLIGKLNRKGMLLGFALLSGFCSVLCALIRDANGHWKSLQIGLELVSFFSATTAFNVLLIYTLELFPTCVRNSALSMARQALVFGGVFSPILGAAGRKNSFYSFGVFGVTIATCSLFVGCLPETKGSAFCDTLDEEEEKAEKAAYSYSYSYI